MGIAVLVTSIGAGIALTWCVYRLYRKQIKKSQILQPNIANWRYVGTLQEITMFPVKSCRGMELQSVECDLFGLSWQSYRDRRLLLLDEAGNVGFAGAKPLMLSITCQINSIGDLVLQAPNLKPIELNIEQLINSTDRNIIKKQMKGYKLVLIECLAEHHKWFSEAVLQKDNGLRLYISLDPIVETSIWRRTIKTDLMSFMVVNNRSVHDLNARLSVENQVNHLQFRGNFLIDTMTEKDDVPAFDEDHWKWLKIGEDPETATILRYNSPCLRCILPNIDVFSCERNADFEPLRTLKKYRLRSHKHEPEMGVYFELYQAGLAKNGDRVYVQY